MTTDEEMLCVYKVKYESAGPVFAHNSQEKPGIGWIDSSRIVVLSGSTDAQVAVERVKKEVLKQDPTCDSTAPVNTIKGFKLIGVELICQADYCEVFNGENNGNSQRM